MNIIFQDKIIELGEVNNETMEFCIQQLQLALENANMMFSHFLVNGVPTYVSFPELIDMYSEDGHLIELISITKEQFQLERIQEAIQYIDRCQPILTELVDQLYQGEDKAIIWTQLADLAEGLNYLMEIHSQLSDKGTDDQMVSSIDEIIHQFIDAMEVKDFTMLADLVQYEIMPIFKQIKDNLKAKEE